MKSFLSNLNARLLCIHFIAFWFFMYAFQMFSFMHDYKFLYLEHINRVNFPDRVDADMAVVEQSGNFGLILAYILSWVVSFKKGWHWINSVIVFLAAFLIENLLLLHWSSFHNIYLSPGGLFHVYSKWGHAGVGATLFVIGLLLLFSNNTTRYISYDTEKDKQKAKAAKKAARKGK